VDLFDRLDPGPASRPHAPLAERMRPRTLEEVAGQDDLVGPGATFRTALLRDQPPSMILWGPPGSGKTTLARLISDLTRARFVSFSAVLSSIKDIKEIMASADRESASGGRRTLLFIDEIHRFNRAQQDAFLPHVEQGTIVLVGATTENPSFSVNAALLSRCSVFVLNPLGEEDLLQVLRRALSDPRGLASPHLDVEEDDLRLIAARSAGDARRALNALETLALIVADGSERRGAETPSSGAALTATRRDVERALQRAALLYDKTGEEHFNLISALIKSMRNGDADAALYWLVRMIESGEDPLYLARRLIRFASEDVGNADPGALRLALSAREAFESLGLPEGALALAQAAVYLAAAPKSDSIYRAYGRVVEDLRGGFTDPVPEALRNPVTPLMRDLGYGRAYRSAHDTDVGTADLDCLPERLRGRRYYVPKPVGHEAGLAERLRILEEARGGQAAKRRPAAPATSAPRPRRTPE
jgi:putative ATPase